MDGPIPRIPLLTIFLDFLAGFFVSDGKTDAEDMAEVCKTSDLPAWKEGCIGPFYGNEYDACPCDVPTCPACAPRWKERREELLPPLPWKEGDTYVDPKTGWVFMCMEFGWLRVQSS